MKRGFTIIEVLIVVALIVFGFLALISVYTSNLRNATLTRGSLLASLLTESMFAEFRDHRYGSPAPPSWGDPKEGKPAVQTYTVYVQGRPVETTYTVLVKQAPDGNGSFFDSSKTYATDVVWCRIQWVEGTEASGGRRQYYFEFSLDVRRDRNLVVPTI